MHQIALSSTQDDAISSKNPLLHYTSRSTQKKTTSTEILRRGTQPSRRSKVPTHRSRIFSKQRSVPSLTISSKLPLLQIHPWLQHSEGWGMHSYNKHRDPASIEILQRYPTHGETSNQIFFQIWNAHTTSILKIQEHLLIHAPLIIKHMK